MTILVGSVLAGMLVMAGVATFWWWASPAQPDLVAALDRLAPHRTLPASPVPVSGGTIGTAGERVGRWAIRRLPLAWITVPTKDLAVLRKTPASFYGDKLTFAAVALVGLPLLCWLFSLSVPMPAAVPVAGTLAAAVVAWFVPDLDVRRDAAKARTEIARALAAYTDLVALERRGGGSGSRQAMELAAEIGDSWPFRRISEALARSRFSGQQPWDALHDLANQLAVTDLDDLADIMRLCGEEGAQVYDSLRAKAEASRNALLAADQAEANATGERMFIPASLPAIVFVTILLVPPIMRLLAS
ncbi:MAG: type II secretion system F family protein [Micropruina sp.]|uniref:type II secretion system F family protein n=1 Tax=Micropruina sp. TaxID=2737536 RepID=UPI0039E3ACA9